MIRTLYRNSKGSMTTDIPEIHWKVALRADYLLYHTPIF